MNLKKIQGSEASHRLPSCQANYDCQICHENSLKSDQFCFSPYLVDLRTEERLALELNVGYVASLGTLDVDLPAELDPGDSEDAPAKGRWKRGYIFFVKVQQVDRTMADVVNCHLVKSKNYI